MPATADKAAASAHAIPTVRGTLMPTTPAAMGSWAAARRLVPSLVRLMNRCRPTIQAMVTNTIAICWGEIEILAMLMGFSPSAEGKFLTSDPQTIMAKFFRKIERPMVASTM